MAVVCHSSPDGCGEVEAGEHKSGRDQMITVEPGFRWIKNAAAISSIWLEKP